MSLSATMSEKVLNWFLLISSQLSNADDFCHFNLAIARPVGNPQLPTLSLTVRLKTKHSNSNNPFTKSRKQRLYNKQSDVRM